MNTIFLPREGRGGCYVYRRLVTTPGGLLRPTYDDPIYGASYAARVKDVIIKAVLVPGNNEPSWSSGILLNNVSVAVSLTSWDEILTLCEKVPMVELDRLSFRDILEAS